MTKQLYVAASPLTGTIFAGSVLKDGKTWAANKCDVSDEAVLAVAERTLLLARSNKAATELTLDGVPIYRITVEKLVEASK